MSRLYIYQGETAVVRFVVNQNEAAMQIPDSMHFDVDIRTTSMGNSLSLSDRVDRSLASDGIIQFALTSEDTMALTPGRATIAITISHEGQVYKGASSALDVLPPFYTPTPANSREIPLAIVMTNKVIEVGVNFLVPSLTIAQELGNGSNVVVSQAAVTNALKHILGSVLVEATEEEIKQMLEDGTWDPNVIYYSKEE